MTFDILLCFQDAKVKLQIPFRKWIRPSISKNMDPYFLAGQITLDYRMKSNFNEKKTSLFSNGFFYN